MFLFVEEDFPLLNGTGAGNSIIGILSSKTQKPIHHVHVYLLVKLINNLNTFTYSTF